MSETGPPRRWPVLVADEVEGWCQQVEGLVVGHLHEGGFDPGRELVQDVVEPPVDLGRLSLADAIAELVGALSTPHLHALAEAYRSQQPYSPAAAAQARAAVPAPHQLVVDQFNAAWRTHAELTGDALALAIRAAWTARRHADRPNVEVVVTGPDSAAAPVRLTSEVVGQLIDSSTRRVTLVSYAAYRIDSVITALDAAVVRGAKVSLILESAEMLSGGGGLHAYGRYQVYCWPVDRRDPPDAKLHAKAVIVDNRHVLLTSANITQAGYDKNIELGVLCRGGTVPLQIQTHFDALIARGVLQPMSA